MERIDIKSVHKRINNMLLFAKVNKRFFGDVGMLKEILRQLDKLEKELDKYIKLNELEKLESDKNE